MSGDSRFPPRAARADNADSPRQARRNSGSAQLEDGADGAGEADVQRVMPDRDRVRSHLAREGEDGEVDEYQRERW